jgi:hypothetical protein
MSSQSVIPAPPEQSLPYEAADVAKASGDATGELSVSLASDVG